MIEFPIDEQLDTTAFSEMLTNTQNSYKHLMFGYLLKEIRKRNETNLKFTVVEIEQGMLDLAKFPAIKCRLSLGLRDQTASILKSAMKNQEKTELLNWVCFRLIRPFFDSALKNKPDQIINESIYKLSLEAFSNPKPPFYKLIRNEEKLQAIEVHKSWYFYILKNFDIINGWRRWHWASYLQRRNPSALNVMQKLEEEKRKTAALSRIRSFWRAMSNSETSLIRCTYSGNFINPKEIVVDHFLPWSYLGHDQYWNLCPTIQLINSKKSDRLPADLYLNSLIDIQQKTLFWVKNSKNKNDWNSFSEVYISALQLTEDELLNKIIFESALKRTILPHYQLAKNMGFSNNWSYS
jgi:hypothetical protein